MSNKPLLSVVMITYGHEKYIRKAVEGVFAQKTNFAVEFIIANDNSSDKTDQILKEILPNSPENIEVRYFKNKKNLGMMNNFHWALQQAKGDYIALCEGDDFWTDDYKLQKQVDFLEKNKNFSIYAHNVKIFRDEIIEKSPFDKTNTKTEYTLADLAKANIFPTVSIVARNHVGDLPTWFTEAPFGDYPFLLTCAKFGKIYYSKEKMAVYRENVGVWSGQIRPYQKIIDTLGKMSAETSDSGAIENFLIQQKNYRKIFLLTLPLQETIKNDNFFKLNIKDKAIIIAKKLAE